MLTREPLAVLIVDDSESDFRAMRDLFVRSGDTHLTVQWAGSYADGLRAIVAGACDVCLVDYDLIGGSGLALAREAKRRGASAPIILLNGHDADALGDELHLAGVDDCLPKWHLTSALLDRSVRYAMERRKVLAHARRLEERFHNFAEHSRVIFFESDPWTQRLLYVSPAYESILGQSSEEACAAPRAWLEHVHEEDYARVTASFDRSPDEVLEFRIVRADGGVRWLRRRASAVRDAAGRVVRIVGTAEDVTALRDAQLHVSASNRIEMFGRLASGVAHDFTNMLTAIVCEAEHMTRSLAHDDPRRSAAQEIIGSSIRAASLTRQLLRFSSHRPRELRELDVNGVVEGIQRLLEGLLGTQLRVVVDLISDPGGVVADVAQLEQVLVNLVVNARDAMPAGGEVVIATRNARVESTNHDAACPEPGDYVVLSVIDQGTGMTEEIKARIFEPFFTTKSPDQGSGLGLACVRDIVERMGGAVVVRSELGVGSTFEAYLPRAR